ncbi:hypothetical protein D3C72_1045230 [compost metagenome]
MRSFNSSMLTAPGFSTNMSLTPQFKRLITESFKTSVPVATIALEKALGFSSINFSIPPMKGFTPICFSNSLEDSTPRPTTENPTLRDIKTFAYSIDIGPAPINNTLFSFSM